MAVKKQKLLQKADALARDKKFRKAISLYKQVIQEDVGDIRTRLRLSELLYQSGRIDEAAAMLQFVGDYYKEHGFLLKSVAVYKKMLEINPARTELHGTLANLYFQLGMAPDAVKQFKAQIRALIKQAKILDSLYVIRSMLELDPANVSDRLRLAESFSKNELIDEAASEYLRVLGILDKNGRNGDWCQVALRYLHHSPADSEVRRKVVEHLVQDGDHHRALQHLHSCIEAAPEDEHLLDLAATCFEMLGQPEKAVVALKSLVGLSKRKGLDREEEEAWVRILRLDPKDSAARVALSIDEGELPAPGDVVLEWDMPGGPPPVPRVPVVSNTPTGRTTSGTRPHPLEVADTVFEDPSFGDFSSADEKTAAEPLSEDLLRELSLDLEDEEPPRVAIDVVKLKKAIESKQPLSPEELDACGVPLQPTDREELEFFLSAGLKDEAIAILQEVYSRLSGGQKA